MRQAACLLLLLATALVGCSVLMPVADVATRPLSKKATFEEIQRGYCSDIRFGLYDEALEHVEPELHSEFQAARRRLDEIRFSDFRIESVRIDPMRTQAVVEVVYRGYWLSSPFEREVTVTQRWRRAVPTQQWYVTPDLGAILDPPGAGSGVAAPPAP